MTDFGQLKNFDRAYLSYKFLRETLIREYRVAKPSSAKKIAKKIRKAEKKYYVSLL